MTPARIDLLEALRRCGPCSVYALAKEVARNYSNVHTDIAKLEEHGLVQRTPEDTVFVPFESVEIHLALFKRAAWGHQATTRHLGPRGRRTQPGQAGTQPLR